MKKIIIILVLLALAAFGVKLYVESQYESELNKAIAMASLFADIQYEKVNIGFDGSITVSNIRVTPRSIEDNIDISEIRLKSSDILFPFRAKKTFTNGQFPDHFSINIKDVNIDAKLIDTLSEGDECKSGQTVMRYTAAGIDRVNTSMLFDLDFSDPFNGRANIRILDQLTTSTIEVDMDVTKMKGTALNGEFPFSTIEWTTELDADLAKNLNEYCSTVFKITPVDFLNKVVGSDKFSQNTFGAALGSDMNAAMIEFMQGGKRFSFRARPSDSLGSMSNLLNLRPNQILNRLNLNVSLDGKRIPLIIARETVEEKQERVDESNNIKVEKNRQRTYVKVAQSNPKQYIGKRIRISRKGDKKSIKGRMTGFSKNRIAIEVYQHGGEMTLNVDVDDIRKLEVYR